MPRLNLAEFRRSYFRQICRRSVRVKKCARQICLPDFSLLLV
ncbi:hypothetical protein CSUNSWCD_280 [Campylobacter showae CSUNSWCD]|uniref:Uncharacterized protein n=1 Tax=Campylobacter showae CSUNSWCD TaxID=1244083 RepID=M5IM32_9BACT|nr:hypothetical protein CSUNSWCD_280 [Campylobacter showae CSUNSWCD]